MSGDSKPEGRATGGGSAINASLPPALMVWNSFLLWRSFQQVLERLFAGLAPTGLKLAHNSILTLLSEGPLSQITLSTRLSTDRTTMVSLIDELEGKGLVERLRNPHDRRLYDVTLTDRGRQTVVELHQIITSVDQEFFAPLSGEEQAQLRELLLKVIRPGPEYQTEETEADKAD